MKKVLLATWRLFCLLSGLILAPVLLAGSLAIYMGVLPPLDRIREALAMAAEKPAESKAVVQPEPIEDASLWHKRLSSVAASISDDERQISNEGKRLAVLEERITALGKATAQVLSELLERPVSEEQLVRDTDNLTKAITTVRRENERFPDLLDRMNKVDPVAVATIVAGEGPQGISREQSIKLLRSMTARKASQVIEELARLNPGLAGQLVEGMGRVKTTGT